MRITWARQDMIHVRVEDPDLGALLGVLSGEAAVPMDLARPHDRADIEH